VITALSRIMLYTVSVSVYTADSKRLKITIQITQTRVVQKGMSYLLVVPVLKARDEGKN
jgi:hypothetical protein